MAEQQPSAMVGSAHRAASHMAVMCPGCGQWVLRGELIALPPDSQGSYAHWWCLSPDDVATSGNGAVFPQASDTPSQTECGGGGGG
jgi:hypothetical protein